MTLTVLSMHPTVVKRVQTHSDTHTPGHGLDALCPVVLIVQLAGDVLQVVHVCPYQDGPQLDKVAVGRVFDCTKETIHNRVISVVIVTTVSC